jgi:hypothetical protein
VHDIVEARESGWIVKVAPRKWKLVPYNQATEVPFDPTARKVKNASK